jgi:hypothetical protein
MKTKLFLISVTLISFFIRIYNYQYPPLLWDEASIGYNAYSIIKTGKDEYGKFLPLIFKSFGDYKPGLYIYFTIPFISIFGLNELSVRLPSIILGSLIPLLLYLLVKNQTKNHKLAIISAIVAALNPYSIHFSRGAWETNILTFELLLASYLFFKNKYIPSAIILGLSLYTYQGAKLISLLLVIILFSLNFSKSQIKSYTKYFIVLFLFTLPIIYGLIFANTGNRLQIMSLFSYRQPKEEVNTIISQSSYFDYTVFHNQIIFFTKGFFSRYFNHYSSDFLAFSGDWQNARHSPPYMGVILYPSLLFLVVGLVVLINQKDKFNLFMFLWLLVAPIPAALSRDSVSSVRAMSFSIPLIYFISLGIYSTLKRYNYKFLYILVFIGYLLSFTYYLDLYYNHMVVKSPNDFLYGYRQLVSYVNNNKEKYQKIYITNYLNQPYIYYLFYSKYDPAKYQQQNSFTENDRGDVGKVNNINNIFFYVPNWNGLKDKEKTLAIYSNQELILEEIENKSNFNKNEFLPLSPINNISTFYAYIRP